MSDVLRRHLDALEANLRLGLAQVDAARHALGVTVARDLPARCAGVDKDHCAEQDGEWASQSTMADPHAVICMGCRFERSGVT